MGGGSSTQEKKNKKQGGKNKEIAIKSSVFENLPINMSVYEFSLPQQYNEVQVQAMKYQNYYDPISKQTLPLNVVTNIIYMKMKWGLQKRGNNEIYNITLQQQKIADLISNEQANPQFLKTYEFTITKRGELIQVTNIADILANSSSQMGKSIQQMTKQESNLVKAQVQMYINLFWKFCVEQTLGVIQGKEKDSQTEQKQIEQIDIQSVPALKFSSAFDKSDQALKKQIWNKLNDKKHLQFMRKSSKFLVKDKLKFKGPPSVALSSLYFSGQTISFKQGLLPYISKITSENIVIAKLSDKQGYIQSTKTGYFYCFFWQDLPVPQFYSEFNEFMEGFESVSQQSNRDIQNLVKNMTQKIN